MPVLTLIDITGTQDYIFTSNRLRDCVAGSELVRRVTSPKMNGWLTAPVLPKGGEVIISGSGTASLRFDHIDSARTFAARLSRLVIDQAPGLDLVVCHRSYTEGDLAAALRAAQVDMEVAKLGRRPNARLLGLGVTAACRETQLPANDLELQDNSPVPVSAEVKARRRLLSESGRELDRRWGEFLPDDAGSFSRNDGLPRRLVFPYELDRLGRTSGERSLIGIVHLDGNGIGQSISQWTEAQAQSRLPDDQFIRHYQSLSDKILRVFEDAFRSVVSSVCQSARWDQEWSRYYFESSLPTAGKSLSTEVEGDGSNLLALPVRPIVLGGDDLTFVCDGRIALHLAETALAAFEEAYIDEFDRRIHASAGVALIRSHTPFSRGYRLAESLCNHAKKWLHENSREDNILDWHIGLTNETDVASMRNRDYREDTNLLTCRPYITGKPETPETWQWLSETVLGTKQNSSLRGPIWSQHRGKVKELAEVARGGRDLVRRTLTAWQIASPGLELPVDHGFVDARTPLLDASELLDLHWPLAQSKVEG